MPFLHNLLVHPLVRGCDLADPTLPDRHRRIIREKRFLRRLYEEWYRLVAQWVPRDSGCTLELGSGGGFMREVVPDVITSDVRPMADIDIVTRAEELCVADGSLKAIVAVNVFHHVPRPELFLAEAARTLRPGGRVVMMEPWVSRWSRFVYGRFHHEPFDPDAGSWSFHSTGPLSGANGAMPWIVFARDREGFAARFPTLSVLRIEGLCPFRYVLSGGVSLRSLAPGFTFAFWRGVESRFRRMDRWAMFALIVLERRGAPAGRGSATGRPE